MAAAAASEDVLALRVSTRIGTNPDDTKCSGPGGSHNSGAGLRLYYDSTSRASRFDATIAPDPNENLYLRSDGSVCGGTESTRVTRAGRRQREVQGFGHRQVRARESVLDDRHVEPGSTAVGAARGSGGAAAKHHPPAARAMTILLSLSPIVVFFVLMRLVSPIAGLIGPFVVSLLLCLRMLRRGLSVKALEIGSLILLGLLAAYTLLAAPRWTVATVRLAVDGDLLPPTLPSGFAPS